MKSNEKSRENDINGELNKTGENNDTKDDDTAMDKDTSQQLKIKKSAGNANDDSSAAIVHEEPTKDAVQG